MTWTLRQQAALLCVSAGIALGQASEPPPASDRPEQLQFDPDAERWVELPEPQPGTPAGDLAIARRRFAAGQWRAARRAVQHWLSTYDDTSDAYPAALLLKGQVQKAQGDYYKAYQTLQALLDEYGGTRVAYDAAVELFNIAEVYLSGTRRKVLGMRLLSGEDTALEILDNLTIDFPDTDLAALAVKTKADYFFRRGEFRVAELEYGNLMDRFPNSRYRRYAMRRSADAALASFAGVRFDDAPLIEAEERYRLYARQYPGVAEQEGVGLILADIREKRARKELEIARYYRRTDHSDAAVFYYRSTRDNWPDTIAARLATDALVEMDALPAETNDQAPESADD